MELQDFIFKRIWGFSLFYKILSACSNLAWRTSVCLFILAFKFDSHVDLGLGKGLVFQGLWVVGVFLRLGIKV